MLVALMVQPQVTEQQQAAGGEQQALELHPR